jgi:hypothetical protein
MHCICVDPAHVEKIFPMVREMLRQAMENGGGDFRDIEEPVLSGEKLLWLALDEERIWAAAVTGLHVERGRKLGIIWACGGHEKQKWLSLKDRLEQFARDEGCEAMRVYGRRGWARDLQDYKLISITLEKAL